jgi:hypothetical protein
VFGTGLTAIADGDLFWHLAAGRHMVQTGRLLRADPFSVSALGRPWIDVHWLFQLAAYGVYRPGGYLALVLAKAAVVSVGAAVLAAVVAREGQRWLFAPALVGALFLARHLLPVRPIVLTLLFLALYFALLEGYRRQPRPRRLLALPLLQIVWVNFQGLSAIGPALLLAYLLAALAGHLLGQRRWFPFQPETPPWRPLALAFAGCVAAAFVSPFGAAAALLPWKLLLRITPAGANVFASEVAENIPPFVLERTAPEQIGHFKWYLAALALSFALARGRLLLSRLFVVAALVTLALMANRNVLLLYWLGTPIAVLNLAPAVQRLLALRHGRVVGGAVAALALAGVGAVTVLAAAREPSLRAPTPFRFPTESARLLAERPGGGTIFAPDHQGGYLIWTLHPRYRPYLDTRLILRTAGEFAEYLDVVDHPERFDAFDGKHHFDYLVLPTGYPDRYLGLLAHVHGTGSWRLLYTDGSEALFGRDAQASVDLRDRATTVSLLDQLERRYRGPLLTAARLHLARLDLLLGALEEAKFVLAPMDDLGARALRARCFLMAGDLSTAETLARSLLAEHGDDVQSLNLLAVIAFSRGDAIAGREWLRRALRLDPFNAEARALLERVEKP